MGHTGASRKASNDNEFVDPSLHHSWQLFHDGDKKNNEFLLEHVYFSSRNDIPAERLCYDYLFPWFQWSDDTSGGRDLVWRKRHGRQKRETYVKGRVCDACAVGDVPPHNLQVNKISEAFQIWLGHFHIVYKLSKNNPRFIRNHSLTKSHGMILSSSIWYQLQWVFSYFVIFLFWNFTESVY